MSFVTDHLSSLFVSADRIQEKFSGNDFYGVQLVENCAAVSSCDHGATVKQGPATEVLSWISRNDGLKWHLVKLNEKWISRPIFKYTVKPVLTTTSEQQPPVNNGQFGSSTASLNLTFIRPLFQTATFSGPKGGCCTQVWLYLHCSVFLSFFVIFVIYHDIMSEMCQDSVTKLLNNIC